MYWEFFGGRLSEARRHPTVHVRYWSARGRRHELTGGGLIRSAGGWHAVKEAYRAGIRLASDERILGSSFHLLSYCSLNSNIFP
jgi:hypothetical protein